MKVEVFRMFALALLCGGLVELTPNFQRIEAVGAIYIRADGSVEPSTAPILNVGNVSYILVGNIYDSIAVERNNVVIDGASYTLQGTGSGRGIDLTGRTNLTIKNIKIKMFQQGIRLDNSSNTTIFRNDISMCAWEAIFAIWSSNNRIYENNMTNNGFGIWLKGLSNNNVVSRNNIIANQYIGVGLSGVSNNIILANNITSNSYGLWIKLSSSTNIITGNCIAMNHIYGIWFRESSNNKIHHNIFINQTKQAFSESSTNIWDDEYPSGGNYWSDYIGIDEKSGPNQDESGSDGIGDKAYTIDAENADRYPFMGPLNTFDAGVWNEVSYGVDVVSNSTISDFYFNPNDGPFVRFNVEGEAGTKGFCRVTVPKSLLWAENGQWTILVDGEQLTDRTPIPDVNFTYLYFTYNHSTKKVEIRGTHVIPEIPSIPSLLLFIIVMLTVIVYKRKHIRKKNISMTDTKGFFIKIHPASLFKNLLVYIKNETQKYK